MEKKKNQIFVGIDGIDISSIQSDLANESEAIWYGGEAFSRITN